jgi:hypothetical protein
MKNWLTYENGRVIGMQGWKQSTIDYLFKSQSEMRRIPIPEVHEAFIHFAETCGEPIGDPIECVFGEWNRMK